MKFPLSTNRDGTQASREIVFYRYGERRIGADAL